LIAAGIHKSNKEHVEELWKKDALPIYKASMSRDRFRQFQRFIRFDNEQTRDERAKTDKAAPIRDIWEMFNLNLFKGFKPGECITLDEQLFPFRGHMKFTQYIPSKPAKYGIKIFWACDAETSYPLKGLLYTGKPIDGDRQVNVGERTVLDLVEKYKGSGRNVTTDNFFISLELSKVLKTWNMTLVGSLRKNKRFLPLNIQASKTREVFSTNFVFQKDVTVCSYVPKKNKSVIMLSSMHLTGEVDNTKALKPEIINYYNKTKGGVDNMDKMVSEYSVQRKTLRWTLAFFYNIINVAALATYIVMKKCNNEKISSNQRRLFLKELALQLCTLSIENRVLNTKLVRYQGIRSAIESCLGREISIVHNITPSQNDNVGEAIVGSCFICRNLKMKQRKTRNSCAFCKKPICSEHSTKTSSCNECLSL